MDYDKDPFNPQQGENGDQTQSSGFGGYGQNVNGADAARYNVYGQDVSGTDAEQPNVYGQPSNGQFSNAQPPNGRNPYEQNNYQDPYSQFAYRNPYQPEPQQVYRPDMEEPVSMLDWIGTILLMLIPCAGLIVYIVWAFSEGTKKSKANFCKAALILNLILYVLYFFLAVMGNPIFW